MIIVIYIHQIASSQFNPLDEENMKAILATEKTIDDLERRLNEYTEELSGIEKVIVLYKFVYLLNKSIVLSSPSSVFKTL